MDTRKGEWALKLVSDAKKQGVWLYQPGVKKWYTPDEFYDLFKETYAPNIGFIMQIQLKHPIEGVAAGFEQIKKMEVRVEEFAKKVIEYYRTKREK